MLLAENPQLSPLAKIVKEKKNLTWILSLTAFELCLLKISPWFLESLALSSFDLIGQVKRVGLWRRRLTSSWTGHPMLARLFCLEPVPELLLVSACCHSQSSKHVLRWATSANLSFVVFNSFCVWLTFPFACIWLRHLVCYEKWYWSTFSVLEMALVLRENKSMKRKSDTQNAHVLKKQQQRL